MLPSILNPTLPNGQNPVFDTPNNVPGQIFPAGFNPSAGLSLPTQGYQPFSQDFSMSPQARQQFIQSAALGSANTPLHAFIRANPTVPAPVIAQHTNTPVQAVIQAMQDIHAQSQAPIPASPQNAAANAQALPMPQKSAAPGGQSPSAPGVPNYIAPTAPMQPLPGGSGATGNPGDVQVPLPMTGQPQATPRSGSPLPSNLPVAPPTTSPLPVPQQGQPQPGRPNFLTQLGLPLILAALGKNNPGVTSSVVGGYGRGLAQAKQDAEVAAANKAKAQQQGFDNNIANAKEEDTRTYDTGRLQYDQQKIIQAQQKIDDLKSTNPKLVEDLSKATDGKSALAILDSEDPQDTHGLRSVYLDKDGNVRTDNPIGTSSEVDARLGQTASHDTVLEQQGQGRLNDQSALVPSQIAANEAGVGEKKSTTADNQARIPQIQAETNLAKANAAAIPIRLSIEQQNAATSWANSNTSKYNSDVNATYKTYLENGGKTTDQATKSQYGSPWGTVYDKTVGERDSASADLAKASKGDAYGSVNQSLVKTYEDKVNRLDALIHTMNTTAPAPPNSALRRSGNNPPPAPRVQPQPVTGAIPTTGNITLPRVGGAPTGGQGYARGGGTYKPTDTKTIGGVTKSVAEWRSEYQTKTGKPAPF